jgi:uncharacterized membrane protein (UPF0182 family)
MVQYRLERGRPTSRATRVALVVLAIVILLGARSLASFAIEYQWWKELGQLDTFFSLLAYGFAPLLAATLIAFAALWLAHARALKFARTGLSEHPLYAWLSSFALLLVGYLIAAGSIDTWTVVRYLGARGMAVEANAWRDSVFGQPLKFYLFDLPFYSDLRAYLLTLVILCVLVYWVAARAWQLRYRLPEYDMRQIDPSFFRLEGGLESRFLRGALVVFLLAMALRFFLARYEMVYNDHGFMVGIDYVDRNFGLPLLWLVILACLAAAALVWLRRWILAASMAASLVVLFAVPRLVSALYVRPNEISIQRPYIQTHIHATRSAYGLEQQMRELEFKVHPNEPINPAQYKSIIDNVRLWDVHAFHDTVTQIQALRPYYFFSDTDVDRYTIDGAYRQVLVTPRELDIGQLPADASKSWINTHFVFTHGYGVVLAEVSKITPDGLPVLFIQNAPLEIKTPSLKLTRPEIYYGEKIQDPIFVHTAQEEFNYPSGETNVHSRYEGRGGFPLDSLPMRVAAALRGGDINILLSNPLTSGSRMMIRRNIRERLETLTGFITWDRDPYLVITDAGRLVWIADGYTTSDAHPYSRAVPDEELGPVNYIRNAVKATIDAYDGDTHLYIFTPEDPIIRAYQNLFPRLFQPAAEMPADLRRHARYPETMFRVQAEVYRVYHMLDPQAFYNKEDMWDLARYTSGQQAQPESVTPTYVVASLPDESQAEFLLLLPFTPRSKDNLIGLMLARCDGDHLGEVVVLQLSKQELIFGPAQIAARINQDQTISKDLTLWNQQGSQVLRAQTLVLPVDNTFLYVDPIYIQATEARMPQLKKVVLAVGNRLIYTDTYEQAIAQLSSGAQALVEQASAPAQPTGATLAAAQAPNIADQRLERVRAHLRRYRELAAQGKWAEAGRELEAIESEVR